MAKGVVRKIDELGRITLPIEYRRSLDLKKGKRVGLYLADNEIYLSTKQEDFIGMTRPLDRLGRIVIPIEFRSELEYTEHQKVDLYIKGEEICIQKKSGVCAICGQTEKLKQIKEKHICNSCVQEISSMGRA